MTDTRELSERYSGAIHSSHLKVDPERCDVDYLIAAGVVQEGLGSRLFRLATEWDLAAGDYRRARRIVAAAELLAADDEKSARGLGRLDGAGFEPCATFLRRRAAQRITEAKAIATTEQALAYIHLKTLPEARKAVGQFAWHFANKRGFMEPDDKVADLAGQALRLFLDANCPACSGRRFNGGHLTPKVWCHVCGATGKAHYHLSKTERHSAFIRSLLAEMDMKCHRVQQQMSRWLRQRG